MSASTKLRSRWITLAVSAAMILIFSISSVFPAMALEPENQHFLRTWQRPDKPVMDGLISRTLMWGPEPFTDAIQEPYQESPDGQRIVQYYDKARMEITSPSADENSIWYVTNGLLVVEMISGNAQLGNDTFEQRLPAIVNVAGDADDSTGPTYASFQSLLDDPAQETGVMLTTRLDRSGNISSDPALAAQAVTVGFIDEVTHHSIAEPFWSFMNSNGTVYENGLFVDSQLFENAFFATGRPVTEAYWANVKVGGQYRDVLMQCFERRCLTYTPGNPDGFVVEAGNVGQHYYSWRYSEQPADEPEPSPTGTQPNPTPTQSEPAATATEPEPTTTPTEEPTPTPTEEASPTPEPATQYRFVNTWGGRSDENAALAKPVGVAVAPNGNVYVIDDNDRVQVFSPDGTWIKSWGSTGKNPGQFSIPTGIAIDAEGFVYVVEHGNQRVQKFDADGALVTHMSFPGYPSDVAVDASGRVFISYMSSHKVWVFQSDGKLIDEWGEYGGGPGQLYIPSGLAVGPDGNIYVADTGNNRFQVFTPKGEYLGGYGSKGEGPGQFKSPEDIAVVAGGPATLGLTIYVSDSANHRIQSFSMNPVATTTSDRTLAATMSFSYTGEFGSRGSDDGQFNLPDGLALDSRGRLYVADSRNDRVQIFGKSFTGGFQHQDSWYDDTRGRFELLHEVLFGPDGRLYTADPELGQIQAFTPGGDFVDQWSGLPAVGLTFDSQGVLYVTNREKGRVEQYDQDGAFLGAWDPTGTTFFRQGALATDSEDNIYVLQSINGNIQKFLPDGTFLDAWGAAGTQPGQLATPSDIAVYGDYLYVADRGNNRIQQFDLEGRFIRLWGGQGSGDGEFSAPTGIVVDVDGYVYVTDTDNHRIQKFTPDGQYLAKWGSEGSGNGQFQGPTAITVDPDGNIYVADSGNYRIQIFEPVG